MLAETITADQIRQALSSTYCAPEWYIGYEVGNSTGASCKRHADAVAINAYPSKGFETRGFEIKVSRQDLSAELGNGQKSDEIARFCDYWFLVVPKGLTDGFTLPPTWGVVEYSEGKLRQKTAATRLEKSSPTQGFLCAMLRGRERTVAASARRITTEREEQIRREASYSASRAAENLRQLREKLDEVKSKTGISLDGWEPTQSIIDKINAAKSLELITRNIRFIRRSADGLLKDAQEIIAAAEAMRAGEDTAKDGDTQ